MIQLRELMSKTTAFVIFNILMILFFAFSGSFGWDLISIISFGSALLLMNGVAWISARRYKDWK